MSDPTIEEMRLAVIAELDAECVQWRFDEFQVIANHTEWGSYPVYSDVKPTSKAAWADAYSKLPAKAAPAPKDPRPDHAMIVSICKECGIKYGQAASVLHYFRSSGWATLSAPESEDEAFERLVREELGYSPDGAGRELIDLGRNARARLDAERGK